MKAATALSLAFVATLVSATFAAGETADPLAPAGLGPRPQAPRSEPVTETLYGTTITDPYRQFEKMGPATVDWMKAQGAYTRTVFDAIKPRAALEKRIAAFSGSFGFIQSYQYLGGRAFYEYCLLYTSRCV